MYLCWYALFLMIFFLIPFQIKIAPENSEIPIFSIYISTYNVCPFKCICGWWGNMWERLKEGMHVWRVCVCGCVWKRKRERWALEITWSHSVHPPTLCIRPHCNSSDSSFTTSKLSTVIKSKFRGSSFNFWIEVWIIRK